MSRAEQEKNLQAAIDLGKVETDITKKVTSLGVESTATKNDTLTDIKKKVDTKIEKSLAARADEILGKSGKEQEQQSKQKQLDKKDKASDDTTSVNSTGEAGSAAAAEQVPVKDRISVPNENDGKSLLLAATLFQLLGF